MANFIKDDAAIAKAREIAAAAADLSVSANKLVSSSEASFRFQNGDILKIPAGLAVVVALTGKALDSAIAAGNPQGYYAFQAYVTRGSKEFPIKVSCRQLFTPTVYRKAEPYEDGLFMASLDQSLKRFGEHGAVTCLEGVPYLGDDIEVKLTVEKEVFLPTFISDDGKRKALSDAGKTSLKKREDYAMVKP